MDVRPSRRRPRRPCPPKPLHTPVHTTTVRSSSAFSSSNAHLSPLGPSAVGCGNARGGRRLDLGLDGSWYSNYASPTHSAGGAECVCAASSCRSCECGTQLCRKSALTQTIAAAASAVVVLSVPVGRDSGSHAGGGRGHDGCAQPAPVWATRRPGGARVLR